jgi:UDP-glucuronate 4-epimerase
MTIGFRKYPFAMRVVVTGAAGFIGSHLTEALLAEGHDVVAIDSFTDYYDPARKRANAEGFDVIEADLETDELDGLFTGVERIYHLAGQPGVRASFGHDFQLYVRRNVLASQRVFEAAAERGIRVVYASSSSIYGDAETYPTREDALPRPIAPYGVTKLACEHLAYALGATAGLDAVGVRFFTVYGPRQRPDMAFTPLLEALAEGRPFRLFGDGSASRSFTYVADAVAGTIAAMELGTRGAIYNVGGGDEATMSDAIRLAEELAERSLQIERLTAARGDVRRTKADVSKAQLELGWHPTTRLQDGLRAQWEWAAARVGAA